MCRSRITAAEAFTSILVPLPFILSAFVLTTPTAPLEKDARFGRLPRGQMPYLSFLGVCSLTAATLVVSGFVGELKASKEASTRRKRSDSLKDNSSRDKLASTGNVHRFLSRILSVGLPFFAASKLGGARVAIIMASALATEMVPLSLGANSSTSRDWKNVLGAQKWTFGVLLLQMLLDVSGLSNTFLPLQAMSGYLSLVVSILILPPPFPISTKNPASITSGNRPRTTTDSTTLPNLFGGASLKSPLVSTVRETDFTIASGVISTVVSFIVFVSSSKETQNVTLPLLVGGSIVAIMFAVSLLLADPSNMRSPSKLGLGLGLALSLIIQESIDPHPPALLTSQVILATLSWVGVYLDTLSKLSPRHKHYHHHDHDHVHDHHDHSHEAHSRVTSILLLAVETWPLLHSILLEKDSRRIFYFMCLNFAFMLIQTFYAVLTGSLGLLSDSIHMLFDCLALVVGLCAAVMSKWPPSMRFPHGFGKMDTLAGFANGVFLMLISIEIVYEAVERFIEGAEMQRIGELLTVSTLGLVVNLVGMMAFGHAHAHPGHDHSHDGHSHSNHATHGHSHTHHEYEPSTPLPVTAPATPSKSAFEAYGHSHAHAQSHAHSHQHDHPPSDAHAHSHGHHHHGHSHSNENMHGIFLHVLADTMGSVSVVISTILIHYTGWFGWDALASIIIAVLIFASAVPLVRSSATRLMLAVPEPVVFDLREALADVGALRGVAAVNAPRFWLREGPPPSEDGHTADHPEAPKVQGVMHVVAAKAVDMDDVMTRVRDLLYARGMEVMVQVERESDERCWCRAENLNQ